MAINRANPSIYESYSYKNYDKPCIFISHKSEDKGKAINIGNYIINAYDIDIYLDIYDSGLQIAALNDDHKAIVNHIHKAINYSTHLMCLISDMTSTSWWVPYEIGYAKKSNREISSLKLKNINDVPSFLKIETVLMGTKSLNEYLKKIGINKIINENYEYYKSNHPLFNYLNWNL